MYNWDWEKMSKKFWGLLWLSQLFQLISSIPHFKRLFPSNTVREWDMIHLEQSKLLHRRTRMRCTHRGGWRVHTGAKKKTRNGSSVWECANTEAERGSCCEMERNLHRQSEKVYTEINQRKMQNIKKIFHCTVLSVTFFITAECISKINPKE